jgi:Zn finger protein HypA/HybF involved in hydrogenase expression
VIAEFSALVESVKKITDIVKAIKSFDERDQADKAVKETLEKALIAGNVTLRAIEAAESQAHRVAELEAEVRQLKDFDREAERYQLAEIGPGVYAYTPKAGQEREEPAHCLCANCFLKRQKSILQQRFQGMDGKTFYCHACGSDLHVDSGRDLPDNLREKIFRSLFGD